MHGCKAFRSYDNTSDGGDDGVRLGGGDGGGVGGEAGRGTAAGGTYWHRDLSMLIKTEDMYVRHQYRLSADCHVSTTAI